MQEFGKGIRDFIYLPQYSSCFVALSDMNIVSRLDSYFINVNNFTFNNPWEKKDKNKGN
jgi:hypothetical protein